MAQPVDAEQPPRLPFPVVGIGASAGGIEAVGDFLDAMPPDSGMAFVVIQHLPPDRESLMAEILGRHTAMRVLQVEDGMAVAPDHVYVIRPGHVLTIREGRLHVGPRLGLPRSANRPIDDFFRSLAEEQRERAICIVMSGMGSNGTAGSQAIKAVGGLGIAQDPESSQQPSMPRHLIESGYADYILRPADMPDVLLRYAGHPYARGGREADAETILRRERHHLGEILAILRIRTRQDFSGYKKPTLIRRVQRRMGLTRLDSMAEYARLLRQSPTEVTALADDLLIHVTGFFRDPEAWDALGRLVIAPLVAAREPGESVRAGVTACSSGEEAYSLAMLLVEESERAAKPLDIKVFATDMAERALDHARAGIYPGGIESEIAPARLARFFTPEDEVYRVRPELRDRVVFAPQNVLQDPPFSRIDIASCRNLLIYLEPEMQQRVLERLHFGLREGGSLFLGTSEAIAGPEDLFEVVDKKARIFRRVGPTRHGMVEFPIRPMPPIGEEPGGVARTAPRRRQGARPSVAQLTQRTLLERHTPPAVTVDRDHHILYYHGDTRPYLQQLSGEPTRDLMLLAREGIRGPVRVALHQTAARGETVTMPDGWVEAEPGRRMRVAIRVSPAAPDSAAEEKPGPPDVFVVSFDRRGDPDAPAAVGPPGPAEEPADELRRLRAELQSMIEELQASNEELRASNEEVMSVNEELQSANEELETSKEEMQSLNEELTAVNAQLRVKVEEHQSARSDLASLLASTDIAVLFLDTSFRIRSYTPAFRDLVDLISSDVGRPLAALARRFDDPDLDADARAVLERLVPVEREVSGSGGRHYLRRVTPYRTTDNRIDGVVLTFVDITARRRAEEELRASEERQAFLLRLSDRLRPLGDPVRVQAEATRLLREHLSAGRVLYAEIDDDGVGVRVHADSCAAGVDSIVGRHRLDAFASSGRALHAGNTQAVPDTERAAGLTPEGRAAGAAIAARAYVAVPLVKEGRAAALLVAQQGEPRAWADAEVALIEATAERSWAAVERARAEAALRESEARLRLALTAARMGVWSWDPTADLQTRDGNLNRMLGLEAVESSQPMAEFLGHIHPDDHPAAAAAFEEAIRRDLPLTVEFRVVRPDGSVRWLRDQGDRILEPEGTTARLAGACVDITELKEAEAALRSGEERLRLILASATDYGILTLGPDRRITSWSPGAEAIFGYAEAEVLGRPSDLLFTPEDRASGEPGRETGTALREGRAADERWHLKKGDERFFASGVLTPLGDGAIGGFVKVLRDLTERKRMEDELRRARDELEARVAERTAELERANRALRAAMVARTELLRRLVSAQEEERRRVARDLHDGLGQELTALILGLKALEAAVPEDAPGRERIREVEEIVHRIGREAHDLAVELRPTALDDIGLDSALAAYIARWAERTGVAADFQAMGLDRDRLPPEVETTVYRVVQEALNNIAKHAGARRVSVIVERGDGELTALIEDDGRGFDPERPGPAPDRRRLGLLGMHERVGLVGGALLVESAEGEGTTVRARIPLTGPDEVPDPRG